MSEQWMRQCELTVGKGGMGLLIWKLRIQFEIVKTLDATPNSATIKVFNLNDDHVAQIENEYNDIILTAGYRDSFADIFAGNIQFVAHYRQHTDHITEITAGDGDRDYRNAFVNETLTAGSTDEDAVDRILATMGDTTKGTVQLANERRVRGTIYTGQARDALTQIARKNGCNWSIQDGKLQMIRTDAMVGNAHVLTAETGLLEAPEHNDKGISVKCLLNPLIGVNSAIKLDNSAIRLKQQKQKPLKTPKEQAPAVRLNKEGIYKVVKLTHQGDNRSNEWYTLLECIGLGQPVPTARSTVKTGAVPVEGIGEEVWQ